MAALPSVPVGTSGSSARRARVEEKLRVEFVICSAVLRETGTLLQARAHSLRDCTAATMFFRCTGDYTSSFLLQM